MILLIMIAISIVEAIILVTTMNITEIILRKNEHNKSNFKFMERDRIWKKITPSARGTIIK